MKFPLFGSHHWVAVVFTEFTLSGNRLNLLGPGLMYGLVDCPKADHLQLRCDEILEAVQDLGYKLNVLYYGVALGRHPLTSQPVVDLSSEQMEEAGRLFDTVILPTRLTQLEALAGAHLSGLRQS